MGGKRPPLDEERALFAVTIAKEGITTSAGEGTGLSLIDAGLKGAGVNSFVSMLAVIYPGQPTLVDSKDITAFDNDTGEVTVASVFKGGEVAAGVPYKIVTFRFVPAEVAAIETIVTAIQATLGAPDTTAATGAVNDVKKAMAYLKELVTGLALDGSAPFSYNYTKATVPGWLHGFHMVRRILFVIPEAIGSITAHNTAIRAELDKMGLVITITQADALTYPDYESITLTVLGSPLDGTEWTTANLEHIKAIFGLPVVCVDATAAAYLEMGVDGVNAAGKTVLNAIANIEGSILGAGIDDTVGLTAGANIVADSPVTFSTLDMSGGEITEIWYGRETTEDETDVLLGEIRKTMPDSTPGKDITGADVPGTLAFYGCAYSMNGLNTLGKAVLHLLVEKLLHSSTAGLAVILSGEVGNLAATIGNRATPVAAGPVTLTDKLMAYVKQLVTELQVVDALVDAITAAGPTNAQMETARNAIIAAIPAMRGTNSAALAASWTAALATALGNYTAALATALGSYTAAKAAFLDEAISAPKVPKSTDESGSFLWDTSAYTTVETDISALFTTPLTGATRRDYSLYLDLTQAEADAAVWTKCTVKVQVKVDGANYRTVDKKEIAKTDVAAAEEPGVEIDIPPVAQDVKITMQFDVQLGADATIYYHVVKGVLE